jgi:hypothetical protein
VSEAGVYNHPKHLDGTSNLLVITTLGPQAAPDKRDRPACSFLTNRKQVILTKRASSTVIALARACA